MRTPFKYGIGGGLLSSRKKEKFYAPHKLFGGANAEASKYYASTHTLTITIFD